MQKACRFLLMMIIFCSSCNLYPGKIKKGVKTKVETIIITFLAATTAYIIFEKIKTSRFGYELLCSEYTKNFNTQLTEVKQQQNDLKKEVKELQGIVGIGLHTADNEPISLNEAIVTVKDTFLVRFNKIETALREMKKSLKK